MPAPCGACVSLRLLVQRRPDTPAGARELWQRHYVANLNHTLWFHTPEPACDDWLLFVSQATRSLAGRGLALAHIYRRDGRLIASMAQDLLISPRTD